MSARFAPSFVSFWLLWAAACSNTDLVWRDLSGPPNAAGASSDGGGTSAASSGAEAGGTTPSSTVAGGASGSAITPPSAVGSAGGAESPERGGTEGGAAGASGATDGEAGAAAGSDGSEVCPPGCCAPLALEGQGQLPVESLLADSRQGFSGTQGQCGWSYGYLPSGAEPFTPLTHFVTSPAPAWRVSTTDPPWTVIYRETQHPNQVPLQWIVRRWTSPVRGPLSVKGHVAKADSGGDGVIAQVGVDGLTVWEQRVDDTAARDFELQVSAIVGTTIDFVVAPRSGDGHDSTEFTASIGW